MNKMLCRTMILLAMYAVHSTSAATGPAGNCQRPEFTPKRMASAKIADMRREALLIDATAGSSNKSEQSHFNGSTDMLAVMCVAIPMFLLLTFTAYLLRSEDSPSANF